MSPSDAPSEHARRSRCRTTQPSECFRLSSTRKIASHSPRTHVDFHTTGFWRVAVISFEGRCTSSAFSSNSPCGAPRASTWPVPLETRQCMCEVDLHKFLCGSLVTSLRTVVLQSRSSSPSRKTHLWAPRTRSLPAFPPLPTLHALYTSYSCGGTKVEAVGRLEHVKHAAHLPKHPLSPVFSCQRTRQHLHPSLCDLRTAHTSSLYAICAFPSMFCAVGFLYRVSQRPRGPKGRFGHLRLFRLSRSPARVTCVFHPLLRAHGVTINFTYTNMSPTSSQVLRLSRTPVVSVAHPAHTP